MPANWPANIPFFTSADGASIQTGQRAVARSTMDVGPAKRRRRTSTAPSTREGLVRQISLAQLVAFRAWFSGDIADGALSFIAEDPFDGIAKSFAIVGGYTEHKAGAGYNITATLEVQP